MLYQKEKCNLIRENLIYNKRNLRWGLNINTKIFLIITFLSFNAWAFGAQVNGIGVDIAGVFKGYSGARGALKNVEGREERIINKVFECMKLKQKIKLAPFGRHLAYFQTSKEVDFVTTVYDGTKIDGYRTNSHITMV